MKTEISSLELSHIVKELEQLKGSRIEKIFSKDNKEIFIQFYKAELGKPILRVKAPNYLYLTTYKPSFSHPSNFCMALRKRLTNGKVSGISKVGNERIVKITIDKMSEYGVIHKKYLYIELFLKGNIILVDESSYIEILSENQAWSERQLKVKGIYKAPVKRVFKLKPDLDEELVKYLANQMNLGGEFAEEICARSSIDKRRKELSDEEIKLIQENIDIINTENSSEVYVYTIDGKQQIYPFRMISIIKYDKVDTFSSLNEALDSVFTEHQKKEERSSKDKESQKKLGKYEKIFETQTLHLEKNKKIIQECTQKGDLIYQNFNYIDELLHQLRTARESMSWKEIKSKLKKHKVIKSVDEKSGKIVLEL